MKQNQPPPTLPFEDISDCSTEYVTAVLRALSILEAFGGSDVHLPLVELSKCTGMNKTTALRIARTLAKKHYLVQRDDGDWRLGRAAGWLGACYQATFDVHDIVEPVLRELTIQTGESASFYVREGNQRTCLARVDGSSGKVLGSSRSRACAARCVEKSEAADSSDEKAPRLGQSPSRDQK